jgi:hypothetical protein
LDSHSNRQAFENRQALISGKQLSGTHSFSASIYFRQALISGKQNFPASTHSAGKAE